jgi:hypothetical protein
VRAIGDSLKLNFAPQRRKINPVCDYDYQKAQKHYPASYIANPRQPQTTKNTQNSLDVVDENNNRIEGRFFFIAERKLLSRVI